MTPWARVAALGLLLGCSASTTAPVTADAEPDARAPDFVDAGQLRDGSAVFFDAALLADAAPLPDGAPGVCLRGSTSGLVCTPSGDQPIPGATIAAATRDCQGNRVLREVTSDARGVFLLEDLAPGLTEVTIRTGSFLARFSVNILAGANVPLVGRSDKACLQPDSAQLAVLTGSYDSIEQILGGLGFAYDLYCGDARNDQPAMALLQDWEALSRYDVLFVNCGSGINLRARNPEVALMRENLLRFVREGGSLYVSDLAADFVGALWPDRLALTMRTAANVEEPACCVCGDCPEECLEDTVLASTCGATASRPEECRGLGSGVSGRGQSGVYEAEVRGELLRTALGSDQLQVTFNLPGWVEMSGVARGVDVLVATAEGDPLMVMFQPEPGGGRVAYTSFHNGAQADAAMRTILAALVFSL